MIARKLSYGFAAGLLAALGGGAGAADYLPEAVYSGDAQLFAPADIDFDGAPIERDCAYFFHYDKLGWAFTGDRTRIGTDAATDASMNPWRTFWTGVGLLSNPIDLGQPLLLGNLDSTPPRSDFSWGERYELGHYNDDAGWMVGVLDGPTARSGADYGWGLTGQDETVGGFIFNENFGPVGPNGDATPDQLASPLGSVIIVFDDPNNLMIGFLDVVDGLIVAGPPGDPLENDSNGDGILDGDGLADDIDEDGQHGPDGFDNVAPGNVPETFADVPYDADDLVRLPTSWQTVLVRNATESQGVEIMRTHRLRNDHFMAKHQNNSIDINYGVRYLRLRDDFNVDGFGGVLGRSFWHTRVDNHLVGPQIAMNWHHQRDRLGVDFNGRFLFGYNISDFEQIAALGEDLITGQLNHPLWFPPSYSSHGKREDDFSPTAEMRVQANYKLTGALSVQLGYSAIFVDNISRAAQQVRYELPRMGFRDDQVGEQNIFINGVNFGFEAVY